MLALFVPADAETDGGSLTTLRARIGAVGASVLGELSPNPNPNPEPNPEPNPDPGPDSGPDPDHWPLSLTLTLTRQLSAPVVHRRQTPCVSRRPPTSFSTA